MAGMIRSSPDPIVWHKPMDLALEVYGLTKRFSKTETYRLVHRVARAAPLVPANMAEEYARDSPNDCARFLAIARGSLMEVETFLQLAIRLSCPVSRDAQTALGLMDPISRILTGLRTKMLRSRE